MEVSAGWWTRRRDNNKKKKAERDILMNLLSFVGHHRQGDVLAHEVQLISQTVGPRDVEGGAVVIVLLHCKERRKRRILIKKNISSCISLVV